MFIQACWRVVNVGDQFARFVTNAGAEILMSPFVATVICVCGIAALLYLDRETNVRTSRALWLPGIWISIVASRSLSEWLGLGAASNVQLDGSPVDAAVFGVLLAAAIGVLVRRRSRTRTLLLANWPILIYFSYCLISVTWSYHPDVALKRWIKAIGDVAMVTIIATDLQPVAAIRRLVSRIGVLLLPTSVLFIKYYGSLGRAYTSDGMQTYTGVTTNKNALGLTVLVICLVVFWNVRSLWIHKGEPNRSRRLVAQSIVLAFGLTLFVMAQCSTGKACFILGSFLIIVSNLRAIRRRPSRIHAICLGIVLVAGVLMLFGGQEEVIGALGRQSSLSGRTDIWAAVLPAVPDSIVGAGFESFWISPNVRIFQRTLLDRGWFPPVVAVLNEAHDGYIEIYLSLGWIGVSLIVLILFGGYRRAYKAFRHDPESGSLFLAYIAVGFVYNISESGFRMLNPAWIFLLLAIVGASAVGGIRGQRHKISTSRISTISRTAVFDELVPEKGIVDASWQGLISI